MAGIGSTCTCKTCYEGWLSPRMRERLECSTEFRYELSLSLLRTQDDVQSDLPSGLDIDNVTVHRDAAYLPPPVRAKLAAPGGDAIYRGYVAVFKTIFDLIRDEDGKHAAGFPTVADVDADIAAPARPASAPIDPVHLAAYREAGGSALPALDCIVDRALEELSPLGREYSVESEYIDQVLGGADVGAECANDLNFALVREKLGLPRETAGPQFWKGMDARDPESDDEKDG
ncbi:uncharacterized protein BXZ73DRAFT_50835 [Epithele typhae]|uniref:uncharacterized protein n=1 Tax=Epithele typhae TaxID=378194 RepID=UPI002007EB84|nr:uncharacterized protein BXZ73DRAFT_50835 [Epithele typhae]KAH9923754.1 hypothetical protein BXZ73DRAFT_50835 [Epithele typhae]